MANSTAQWLCDHLGEFRGTLLFTFDKVGPDGDDARGALLCEGRAELHANIDRWMKANEAYIEHVPSLQEALGSETHCELAPIQAMLCGPIERMRAAEAHLLTHPAICAVGAEPHVGAEITLHRTEYPERNLSIVDILPAGCSKASALEELTAAKGFGMQDVLAIGDNWNDVPMLRAAGQAALMGNAPPELKVMAAEQGWTRAPANTEDGVAVVLETIFTVDGAVRALPISEEGAEIEASLSA